MSQKLFKCLNKYMCYAYYDSKLESIRGENDGWLHYWFIISLKIGQILIFWLFQSIFQALKQFLRQKRIPPSFLELNSTSDRLFKTMSTKYLGKRVFSENRKAKVFLTINQDSNQESESVIVLRIKFYIR